MYGILTATAHNWSHDGIQSQAVNVLQTGNNHTNSIVLQQSVPDTIPICSTYTSLCTWPHTWGVMTKYKSNLEY